MPQKNIAIVGAGLAGLSAALELEDRGYQSTIFEARSRPGGRVWSEELKTSSEYSETIERGAEFILEGYTHLDWLLKRFNLSFVDSGMSYYQRTPVDYPEVSIDDLAHAGQKLTQEMTSDEQNKPVSYLLKRSDLPQEVKEALAARIEISAAIPTDQVPGSALEHVASFKNSASWRIKGGNQQLPNAIASSLSSKIYYQSRVEKISFKNGQIEIRTNQRMEAFDEVIVALPLQLIRQTSLLHEFLSEKAHSAFEKLVQGHAAKFHALLEQEPKTSATMSVAGRYWCWTARTSKTSVGRVLNGFIGSSPAISPIRASSEPAAEMEKLCKNLRPDLIFSENDQNIFTDWENDPYALGAYAGRKPGVSDNALGPLRDYHSGVLLAGEYLGGEKIGLMEGAIRSGQQAAQKLTAEMA